MDEHRAWLRILLILLVVIAGLYLFHQAWALAMLLGDVITLFFLAWLLSFMLSPVARFLDRRCGLPRLAAIAIVYLGLLLMLVLAGVLLVPVLVAQLAQLGEALPQYADALPGWISPIQQELERQGMHVDFNSLYRAEGLPAQIERVGTFLVQNAFALATGLAAVFFSTIIVLILSFYMMLDSPRIAEQMLRLAPRAHRLEVRYLLDSIDQKFGGFIRGMVLQAVLCGLVTALVMGLAGLGYVLVISLFVALVMFIPFLGPILAVVPPALVAFVQLPLPSALAVTVAIIVLQFAVLNLLGPKLMAEAVGMHPLLVFLAMLVGAKLAGVAGAIFGVPVAGVINAMAVFFYRRAMNLPLRPRRRGLTGTQAPTAVAGWFAQLQRRLFPR